jgi:hypothetical protein
MGALLAVLILVAVAGTLAWEDYKDAQSRALGETRARAMLASSVIDTYFRGEFATLRSIADSPPVVQRDAAAMKRYFKRLQPPGDGLFSAGLVWIDRQGFARVSAVPRRVARHVNVSDRSYFSAVMATEQPYVSEGLKGRLTNTRMIVMAVPTHDARGRLTGVLTASLLPGGLARALNLGGPDIAIFDREGRSVLSRFTTPANAALERSLSGTGIRAHTRGLDG